MPEELKVEEKAVEPKESTDVPEGIDPRNIFEEPSDDEDIPPEGMKEGLATDETPRGETAPAGEKGDAEQGEQTPPVFDEGLLTRAQQLGLSREEATSFGDPQHLQQALGFAERTLVSAIGQREQQAAQAAQEQRKEPEPEPELKLDLDPKEYDEGIINTFAKVKGVCDALTKSNKALAAELSALKEEVGEVSGTVNTERDGSTETRIDGIFESMGEGYVDLFGKGASSKLPPGGPAITERSKVVNHMIVLGVGYKAMGIQVPPEAELAVLARNALYPDRTAKKTEQQIIQSLGKREKQIISRPTYKNTPETKPGVEKAVKGVKTFLNEQGVAPDGDEAEEQGF